jgi:hypothetical protein
MLPPCNYCRMQSLHSVPGSRMGVAIGGGQVPFLRRENGWPVRSDPPLVAYSYLERLNLFIRQLPGVNGMRPQVCSIMPGIERHLSRSRDVQSPESADDHLHARSRPRGIPHPRDAQYRFSDARRLCRPASDRRLVNHSKQKSSRRMR